MEGGDCACAYVAFGVLVEANLDAEHVHVPQLYDVSNFDEQVVSKAGILLYAILVIVNRCYLPTNYRPRIAYGTSEMCTSRQ